MIRKFNIYKKFISLILIMCFGFMFIGNASAETVEEENPFTKLESVMPKVDDGSVKPDKSDRQYDEAVYIKKVEITGNRLVRQDEIMDAMSLKEGMLYDKDAVKFNLKQIYDMGYFTDKIKAVPVASPTGVTLKIQVEENIPITGFNITGNKVISNASLQELLAGQVGKPQNILAINKAITEIEGYYAQNGYILARVDSVMDDPDGVVNIDINEGVVDEIKITGNKKTRDYVITRNISVEKNTVYNENIMQQDINRLYNTQSFANVKRNLTPSDKDPEKYCLTVEVQEKRTGSISIGGGLDLSTGLFGSAGYVDRNFFGRGQTVSLNFTTGTGAIQGGDEVLRKADFQLEARFVEPRLRGSLTSMDVRAYGSSYASFQVPLAMEKRFGGEVEFIRPLKKYRNLAAGISTGIEYIDVTEGSAGEIANVFQKAGVNISQRADELVSGLYFSIAPSLVYDTRDNIIDPRTGILASLKFKEALQIAGDAGSYGFLTASVKTFHPVGKKSVFTLTGRAGADPFDSMPEFAAFRLGGARTIRGFKEGHVGRGRGYLMASAEYRTPVPFLDRVNNSFINNIKLAGFVDAGQVFRPTLSNQLYNWPGSAISAGVGLRIIVPGIGPLSLDYAIPLTNPGDGGSKSGWFTFFFGESY